MSLVGGRGGEYDDDERMEAQYFKKRGNAQKGKEVSYGLRGV
jgi:hypothetical protein